MVLPTIPEPKTWNRFYSTAQRSALAKSDKRLRLTSLPRYGQEVFMWEMTHTTWVRDRPLDSLAFPWRPSGQIPSGLPPAQILIGGRSPSGACHSGRQAAGIAFFSMYANPLRDGLSIPFHRLAWRIAPVRLGQNNRLESGKIPLDAHCAVVRTRLGCSR